MGKCLFMRKGEVHTAPSADILVSDLAVGSIVKLNESGSPVEYLVVNQGIPSDSTLYDSSCDGAWLLRKDVYATGVWDSGANYYATSTIHNYLTNNFLPIFDSTVQSLIKTVKIPHCNGAGGSVISGSSGLSTKCFLLSGYEVGCEESWFPVDGACLSYFNGCSANDERRKAYFNGSGSSWWTRSNVNNNTRDAIYIAITCDNNTNPKTATNNGIRPALILPSNALFDRETLILKGVS